MGKFSSAGYVDVWQNPTLGRLDPSSCEDGIRDATLIRKYIHLQKQTQASSPGRAVPAIAREVLLKVWEAPRTVFNEEALKGFSKTPDLRKKLLWIPWSIEAMQLWQRTKSAAGLVLEHVTPIDWMWQSLRDLDEEFMNPHLDHGWSPRLTWEDVAAGYLQNWWTVAVVTQAQATAIDSYASRTKPHQSDPVERYSVRNPFDRYRFAEGAMDTARACGKSEPPFSTAKFVLPGRA